MRPVVADQILITRPLSILISVSVLFWT